MSMHTTFTPQQVMGAQSFNPRVRIGNWSEDLEYQEAKFKEFLRRKEAGTLASNVMKQKMNLHLQSVQLTPVKQDKNVRLGAKIMFYNEEAKAFLLADLDKKLHHMHERYQLTCSQVTQPIARGCFIIEKANSKENAQFEMLAGDKDILRYGMHVHIRICSELSPEKNLYLRSEKVSPTVYSQKTKNQEAALDPLINFYSTWKVEYIDPGYRLEHEGEPVKANFPVLLKHCPTHEVLAAMPEAILCNDFGKEQEVCCKRVLDVHRLEKKQNYWTIVCGAALSPEEEIIQYDTVNDN